MHKKCYSTHLIPGPICPSVHIWVEVYLQLDIMAAYLAHQMELLSKSIGFISCTYLSKSPNVWKRGGSFKKHIGSDWVNKVATNQCEVQGVSLDVTALW